MSAVGMNHWNWHEHLMSPSFTPLKAQKSGNRERIIEAAIELMNRKGSNIGTAQIAEHTSISPGNIYYHFDNFSEIALEVVQRLRDELMENLALPSFGPVSAAQLVDYYVGGAAVLWRYRFVVSASRELASRSAELENLFQTFTDEGIESVRKILENLFANYPGKLPVDDALCSRLAENMWVLWSAWPRHVETRRTQDGPTPKGIATGLQQIALTVTPYIDADFYRQVEDGLVDYVTSLEDRFLKAE